MMIPKNYLEKVYGSILAMNAGIRLGAPVEPPEWTAEMIQDVFGEIKDYVKVYNVFSADDDANGPIFFIRALLDHAKNRHLQPEDVVKTWLNYLREGLGMIWWGGDQISTEHTAYLNLKKGIGAPRSGSIEQNGETLAEQIGGQIFIDSFGLIFPNNPSMAAQYAEIAASVSHDRNGIYGARFIAACIALAFAKETVQEVISEALKQIPEECTYAKVVQAVVDFHKTNPTDFRSCLKYLEEEWGYDKYGGVCHIIPNAGVCILALLYGEGDVSRTIEIATMCGWDTDCNAGTVGSIVGALTGIDGIAPNYRKPINDSIVASSVSGYLNIVDLPTFAKQIALLGYRKANEEPPAHLVKSYNEKEIYFDFTLPGSTHGFCTSYPFKTFLRNSANKGYSTSGSLEIIVFRMYEGDLSTVFYRTFYRRSLFMDEKYSPTFAPTAYSGQTVSMKVRVERLHGKAVILTPYVRTTFDKKIIKTKEFIIANNIWRTIEFIIPDTKGDLIEEVGLMIHSDSSRTERAFSKIFLDEFRIHGSPSYEIDFSKQAVEFRCVTPFAHHRGKWKLEEDKMKMESNESCFSFTGHYYMEDASIEAQIIPESGNSHGILFRSLGTEQFYYAGFDSEDKVSIGLKNFDATVLATKNYKWQHGELYHLKVKAMDNILSLYINDELLLTVQDDTYQHGMWGFYAFEGGECSYGNIKVN
ncbi:ADP-ribosylglycohydrolase family protein [Ureibacillus aquaedulcis]|uniref:ADP-ribosylglycohydrolase family protein n=1 Tax=Ureibacillus aquaedulcis TaxID=3058421 RepID=A0ABT8GQG4_9BACL|nr:ADP-ribosylglycohydrolase family protein [Ureibacillus sp. BA0131]MDN4493653.1 ADP-ribosylglycohydrolase family protein [Ureibacillus sp. BA0131]